MGHKNIELIIVRKFDLDHSGGFRIQGAGEWFREMAVEPSVRIGAPEGCAIDNIPDKSADRRTTSRRFKCDIVNYFGASASSLKLLEAGCSVGFSTLFWSHHFRMVESADIRKRCILENQSRNQHRENVYIHHVDLYKGPWNWIVSPSIEVVVIDARHAYPFVRKDIENSLRLNGIQWLVFDDFGLFCGVKKAVLESVERGELEIVQFVGHAAGTRFGEALILRDWEGVICKVAS